LHADAAFLVLDLPRNTHHSRHALSSSFLQPPIPYNSLL
jgi:hypothetical protein